LVSPWMPNGTLNSYLTREHETPTWMDKLLILKQITEGLKHLHDNNVIHGDLTSNNVLIAADGSPRLADFGVSNIMVQSIPEFSFHNGAVRWVAPELIDLLEGQAVPCATKSSDIYALGCIMLEVSVSFACFYDADTVPAGIIRQTTLLVDQASQLSHSTKVPRPRAHQRQHHTNPSTSSGFHAAVLVSQE
ncbi:kinase-like protein, partial [Suillus hirtellus]